MKMNTKKRGYVHVMLDIETLGVESDTLIFQIAASKFDIKTGEIRENFNVIQNIDVVKSVTINPSTLLWWLETNPLLLRDLLAKKGGKVSDDILLEFKEWIDYIQETLVDDVLLWGNGVIFDNRFIREQMAVRGLEYPIKYKNDRDVRTILALAAEKLGVSEVSIKERLKDDRLTEHHALDDVEAQVKLVSYCHNVLMGKS